VRLRPDASYLVTGGLGALGLRIAHWLVEQGARYLILTGRRGLPERSTWDSLSHDAEVSRKIAAIQDMEERRATVHAVSADITDVARMTSVFEPLGRTQPPLRGVVHAAGVFMPQTIQEMDFKAFQAVLRPKVEGTWVLHQLTQEIDLDFFVLFSSAASVWGSAMAAHYVAANHFLDIFAHHRHALGLPALSVNWGWWDGSGMISQKELDYFKAIGLQMIPQDQGFSALGLLMGSNVVQKTVAPVDWSMYKPVFEAKRRRPLLDLIEVPTRVKSGTPSMEGRKFVGQLEEMPPNERLDAVIAYIQGEVVQVLGLEPSHPLDAQQGFFQIGMDSITSVELKTRLEASLGITLPATVAFEYPTAEALAGYLIAESLSLESSESSGEVPVEDPVEQEGAMAALEGLSEEELITLLEGQLPRRKRRGL